MTGLREKNKADKAKRLRAAAAKAFKERGYEASTMRDIAAHARLGLGTVYNYVRDKRGLLEMISSEDLLTAGERIFAALPSTLEIRAALLFIVREIYAHHAQDVQLARIIVKELSFGKHEGDAHTDHTLTLVTQMSEVIARAQARGELRTEIVPVAAAMNVFALHFFYLVAWLSGAMDDPMPAFEMALDLQLSGLQGSKR